jgi:drug/metabolite transporter (DMT)-like permease
LKRLLAHPFAPEGILLFATALWGLAFLLTRLGVAAVSPAPFVAMRFATAAIVVWGVTGVRLARTTPIEMQGAACLAMAMAAGYILPAVALQTLGAGHTAFISALCVPIVPVLQYLVLRQVTGARIWVGVCLATFGLMFMAGGPGGAPSRADVFALGGAFGVAAEVLLMSRFAPRVDPRRLAVLECAGAAAYAVAVSVITGTHLPAFAPGWIACALSLGAASAFLQVSTNWCMRRVRVHRAMLIFATEPVWGAFFGALHGERFGLPSLIGAAFILSALLFNAKDQRLT